MGSKKSEKSQAKSLALDILKDVVLGAAAGAAVGMGVGSIPGAAAGASAALMKNKVKMGKAVYAAKKEYSAHQKKKKIAQKEAAALEASQEPELRKPSSPESSDAESDSELYLDEKNGLPYSVDHATGVKSYSPVPPNHDRAGPKPAGFYVECGMEPVWSQYLDHGSGREYYFNLRTGEAYWAEDEPESTAGRASVKGRWKCWVKERVGY